MSSSNLPPGVTASMIPGNRPEDEWYDKFHDAIEVPDEFLEVDPEAAARAVNLHLQGLVLGLLAVKAAQAQIMPFPPPRCEAVLDGPPSIQCGREEGHHGDHNLHETWWAQ